jgi:hypothetical protein
VVGGGAVDGDAGGAVDGDALAVVVGLAVLDDDFVDPQEDEEASVRKTTAIRAAPTENCHGRLFTDHRPQYRVTQK